VAWVWLAGLSPAARGADIETRDFRVLVDGKPAGEAHMTIQRRDDGLTVVQCSTSVLVRVFLITYRYSYQGQEVWKAGRLQSLSSSTNDDGTRYTVQAVPGDGGLRVRVNGHDHVAAAESWLTSYWTLPDPKLRGGVVPLIDADTGQDLDCRITFAGAERLSLPAGEQNANHYQLRGKVAVDVWYDAAERLVRREWVEQGHRTVLELEGIRR
jgi:hypothetical protein